MNKTITLGIVFLLAMTPVLASSMQYETWQDIVIDMTKEMSIYHQRQLVKEEQPTSFAVENMADVINLLFWFKEQNAKPQITRRTFSKGRGGSSSSQTIETHETCEWICNEINGGVIEFCNQFDGKLKSNWGQCKYDYSEMCEWTGPDFETDTLGWDVAPEEDFNCNQKDSITMHPGNCRILIADGFAEEGCITR